MKVMMYDPSKKSRHTKEQVVYLEKYYAKEQKPNVQTRNKISETINLDPRSVQVWFQNRRAKDKASTFRPSRTRSPNEIKDISPRSDKFSISSLINHPHEYKKETSISDCSKLSISPAVLNFVEFQSSRLECINSTLLDNRIPSPQYQVPPPTPVRRDFSIQSLLS